MMKIHKNWPTGAPGNVELEEHEVEPMMRHLEEQEAKGIPGIYPLPDTIQVEEVDDEPRSDRTS